MSRPARSRVRHGMASCARYGCTRPECRRAYRITANDSHRSVRAGISARVDAGPVAEYARTLVAAGMPAEAIAARSGITTSTVTRILSGRRTRIYRVTAEAILGVKPITVTDVDGMCDAVGARRRLRALTAIGHTVDVMAREAGVSRETLSSIRSGRRTRIRVSMDRTIARLYDQLWRADPLELGSSANGSSRARSYARRHKWAPPAAWDDDEISLRRARPKGLNRADYADAA